MQPLIYPVPRPPLTEEEFYALGHLTPRYRISAIFRPITARLRRWGAARLPSKVGGAAEVAQTPTARRACQPPAVHSAG